MTLQDVIAKNTARRRRAKELNLRSGAAIFAVLDYEALQAWLMPRLAGARREAEVADLSALVLPPLDAEQEAAVLRDNPDTVTLLGEELVVEYKDGRAPRIILKLDPDLDRRWLELPVELTLPGGRAVEMGVQTPYGYEPITVSTGGAEVVEKVRAHLNRALWAAFESGSRPELPLPDISDPTSTVPEIGTVTYGQCAVTDAPLLAYGTVAVRPNRYYASDPWFVGRWYQSRGEAEREHASAIAKLAEVRAEAVKQAAEEAVRAEAREAERTLREFRYRDDFRELSSELRADIDTRTFVSAPYELAACATWTAETKAFIAEVETALGVKAAEKAETERLRLAEEESDRQALAAIFTATASRENTWDGPLTVSQARQVRDFAEACLGKAGGNRDNAVRKLATELNAPYGRERRQEAIRRGFPGVHATETGDQFFHLSRAEDVDSWLQGALAWLKTKNAPVAQPKEAAPPPPAPKAKTKPTSGGLDLSKLGDKFTMRK